MANLELAKENEAAWPDQISHANLFIPSPQDFKGANLFREANP
jgi:hypothetical protein